MDLATAAMLAQAGISLAGMFGAGGGGGGSDQSAQPAQPAQNPQMDVSGLLSELGGLFGTAGAGLAPQQDSWQFRLGSLVAQQAQTQMQQEQNKLEMAELFKQNALGQQQVQQSVNELNQQGTQQSTQNAQTQTQNQPQSQVQAQEGQQSSLGNMLSSFLAQSPGLNQFTGSNFNWEAGPPGYNTGGQVRQPTPSNLTQDIINRGNNTSVLRRFYNG